MPSKASLRAAQLRWRAKNPQSYLYGIVRCRALSDGLEFTLTREDIKIPEMCPILKVPLEMYTRYAPSVDRIDNDKGYTPDNIQVISRKANTMKSDASRLELLRFAEWINTIE